jgi:5-methylcytosine-specific restriction endonuclease McrA
MGFLDGFMRGLNGAAGDKEILDMVNDEDDELLSSNYRKTAMEHTESNNGWYKCVKCGKSFRKGDMDIDHIIPKSKGGTNSRYNLQCICKHCNRSKRDDTSDTEADLKRRKKELKQEEKEDLKLLKRMRKNGGK